MTSSLVLLYGVKAQAVAIRFVRHVHARYPSYGKFRNWNIMSNEHNAINKYSQARSSREDHVHAVLDSQARKKIVVAGPGTGKTYLFKEILRGKNACLTLTFINALVEDLALDLFDLSEVKTLHGFARSALASATKVSVNIFPKLSYVIKNDANIILNEDIDFDYLFHNRDDENEYIAFYRHRKKYYENFYGYSDIIFGIVKYFEKNRSKLPRFDLVLVDEFQDFNKLEVSLIDLLSEKSPILLAGDDDQALYGFKSASAEYIRDRHSDANTEYASFVLPYCSRCTRVIVDAANDVIRAAAISGRLKGRIDKPYFYFDDKDKDVESNQNATLVYAQKHTKQIPWFIEQQINEIAKNERGKFTVLIISPFKKQSELIVDGLRNKGFENIATVAKKGQEAPTILDGLKLLLKNNQSNLGWRIVCQEMLEQQEFELLIKETDIDLGRHISDIVDVKHQKRVREMLAALRKVKNAKALEEVELDEILRTTGFDPYFMAKAALKDEITEVSSISPAIRKIPIKATTIQSSKGLAGQYVFITHFEDRFFIKDDNKANISDQDICNFVVALTRTQRKVFLISSVEKDPTFLTWISEERIERL